MSGYPKSFWIGTVIGGAVMVYGVFGLLGVAAKTKPSELALFVVGAAIAHDLVVAPLVLGVAAIVSKVAPRRLRPPLAVVLIVGAITTLFAFPFVRGYGRISTNPSILPRDYGRGLAALLALIVLGGVVWTVARLRST